MKKLLPKLKTIQSDCTEVNLPHNRWQVFWDVLKRRWRFLIATSLLTSLFCLPFFVWNLIVCQSIRQLTINVETTSFSQLFAYINTKGAVNIVLLAICGIGLSGGAYIIQRLVWGEIVFVGDFWQGVKDNSWKNIFVFALLGISMWSLEFVLNYMPVAELTSFQRMIFYGLSILLVAYIAVVCVFFVAQNAVYNVKFFACLKNSFILALKGFFPTLGFVVVAIIPQIIPFLFYNTIVDIVGYILIAFYGVGYMLVVLILVADYVLDNEINKKNYPQIVGKGIVRNK